MPFPSWPAPYKGDLFVKPIYDTHLPKKAGITGSSKACLMTHILISCTALSASSSPFSLTSHSPHLLLATPLPGFCSPTSPPACPQSLSQLSPPQTRYFVFPHVSLLHSTFDRYFTHICDLMNVSPLVDFKFIDFGSPLSLQCLVCCLARRHSTSICSKIALSPPLYNHKHR